MAKLDPTTIHSLAAGRDRYKSRPGAVKADATGAAHTANASPYDMTDQDIRAGVISLADGGDTRAAAIVAAWYAKAAQG
jgi:hypothetical protein